MQIFFKTDDDLLFEESIEYFNETGYEITELCYDLHNSDFEGNIVTEYENRFASMGMPIYRLEAFLPDAVPALPLAEAFLPAAEPAQLVSDPAQYAAKYSSMKLPRYP